MIRDFGNKTAADLFHKGNCKRLPRVFWKRAIYLLDILEAVSTLEDLQVKGFPPSLRLHKLKGEMKGRFAIDIHKKEGWRITFVFESSEFVDVKVEDYH